MTAMSLSSTGAASACKATPSWQEMPWPKLQQQVLRLQMRIAKAERGGRRGKVKALQHLLTHSFAAKCLAVKRVTSSSGSKTPGVDGKTWSTNQQKIQGVFRLKRRSYKPQPLRRIYIPKKTGTNKLRPLSIPTMHDRAQQSLYLLGLEPIVEERADLNAYGFRLKRSTHDAIEQCFNALGKAKSPTWILEGDIESCFDKISHKYLLKEIPMDKIILKKFLKSGYMEKNQLYPTTAGTPQGGVCSPALAVLALSGLEATVRSTKDRQQKQEKINMIAYADDFVITAATKDLLEEKVKPILEEKLARVGLNLSKTKTKITHINEGFDFLGFNVRKYKNGKLLIKPAEANITQFLQEIRTIIKQGVALPTEQLIHLLNAKITGWVNYYRTVVSSDVFYRIDSEIVQALLRWGYKRHARKGKRWIVKKYFTSYKSDNWRFHCVTKDKKGKQKPLYLRKASDTKIRRHVKIKSEATPFDPQYKEYFIARETESKRRKVISNYSDTAGLRIIQPY